MDFDQLRKDLEAATPGPWHSVPCHMGEECWCRVVISDALDGEGEKTCVSAAGNLTKANARLIAAAPDLARLALLVPELRQWLIYARSALKDENEYRRVVAIGELTKPLAKLDALLGGGDG